MTESFPILLAILFVVFSFIFAMNKGVTNLLASGLALAVGLVILWGASASLPRLAATYLDVTLGWKPCFGIAVGLALAGYLVARVLFGLALKKLFNPDHSFHRFVDGAPGGFLSLLPSLVTLILFFTCVRAAGTVQELNFLDTLAQAGIERAAGTIPAPPISIRWRNAVECLPFVASLLDRIDPFSRRASRHAAAMTIVAKSVELRARLLGHASVGALLESPRWTALATDPLVAEALTKQDRVALVTAPAIQAAAAEPELHSSLESLVLLPALESFVHSLVPVAEPEPLP